MSNCRGRLNKGSIQLTIPLSSLPSPQLEAKSGSPQPLAAGAAPCPAYLRESARARAVVSLTSSELFLRTVKAIATSDGNLIQHITYDSFGNVLDLQGEELGLPVGFAGGVRDRHLGLIRFGHRDYDPAIGRFTAPDPLGDTGGDHDLWEYCVDDPVNAVDPEGLQSKQQNDEVESGNIVSQIGQWFSSVAGDTETPESMNERSDNVKDNWKSATNKLNTAGSGGEMELIDQIYNAGIVENWGAMTQNADDAVESLGPNLIKLPKKATPGKRP